MDFSLKPTEAYFPNRWSAMSREDEHVDGMIIENESGDWAGKRRVHCVPVSRRRRWCGGGLCSVRLLQSRASTDIWTPELLLTPGSQNLAYISVGPIYGVLCCGILSTMSLVPIMPPGVSHQTKAPLMDSWHTGTPPHRAPELDAGAKDPKQTTLLLSTNNASWFCPGRAPAKQATDFPPGNLPF